MKKIASLLLAVSMLLCVFALYACDSGNKANNISNANNDNTNNNNSSKNQNACTHSYSVIKEEANCLQGGKMTYKCSLCGYTYEKYEKALGHTLSNGTCLRCGESFLTWDIKFYVDEFYNPTDQAYMSTSDFFHGTFSNSVAKNAILYARICVDTQETTIRLWEYGMSEVNAYAMTDYDITILDDSGNKHYTSGTMYENGDRIYLKDWTLVNLLQENAQLQIYIRENAKYGYDSTYLFTVQNINFNSVFSDFYYNYMN